MKKIATVSVLAIMAVSAARADIASTTYVDKTAAGAVTTGLSATGNITAAITAATNDKATKTQVAEDIATAVTDMATQNWVTNTATAAKATADAAGNVITATYALQSKVGEVDLATTTYMKNDSDLTAAVKSLDTQLSNVAGGNLAIKQESITATEIKNGAVGTDELADGAVTELKLGDDVKAKYATKSELPTAVSQLTNDSKFQTESEVSSAIATATTDMAKKSDINDNTLTITVNNANAQTFTANAAADKIINIPVPTTVGELTNDANYQNADQVSTAISTATTAENGVVKTAIDNALGSYSTTEQMNTALNEKIDKTAESSLNVATAVSATKDSANNVITETYATKTDLTNGLDTKLNDTAAGSATLPIYIDENGVSQTITSYEGKAATAGTADNYNAESGTIKTKFDGVDASLAKVSALGNVPVPDKCKTDAFDCTLVVKYDQVAGAAVPQWEAIAR